MARRLRVLHVSNMWPTGERPHYGAFVKSQVESLQATGIECSIVSTDVHGGVRKYATLATRCRDAIRRDAPDVVHAHYGWTGAAVAGVCRLAGLPLVISYCGGDLNGEAGLLAHRLKHFIGIGVSIAAGYAATVLVVKSDGMLARLPDRLRARAHVIPNGVDTDLFHPISRDAARAKLRWGARPVVLFVGRTDDPIKNYPLALRAVSAARRVRPDLEFRLVSGVAHADMPLVLNASNLLLLTSVKEGSPNVVKESMACDLPVVSVAVGDTPRLLVGVPNARIVEPAEDRIAEAIVTLLEPGHRAGGGRERLQALGLDAATVASRIRGLYESVAAARRSPHMRYRQAG